MKFSVPLPMMQLRLEVRVLRRQVSQLNAMLTALGRDARQDQLSRVPNVTLVDVHGNPESFTAAQWPSWTDSFWTMLPDDEVLRLMSDREEDQEALFNDLTPPNHTTEPPLPPLPPISGGEPTLEDLAEFDAWLRAYEDEHPYPDDVIEEEPSNPISDFDVARVNCVG